MKLLNRRLVSVLRVYAASWLTWVVLAIYLLALTLILGLDSQAIRASQSIGFGNSWNLTAWHQIPTDPSGVTTLSINSNGLPDAASNEMAAALQTGSPLRAPGRMPKLKHLVIWGALTESQLIPLLENLKLESLSITYLDALSPAGWDALARQPLKSLDILSADERFWEGIMLPRSLETLLIRNLNLKPLPQNETHLKPLLELPQLRTLQLYVWEREGGGLRNPDLGVISRLPSLRRFYVDGYLPGIAARVQRELPVVAVRPGTYESSRVSKVQLLLTLEMLPLILILHILSLQFATPASKLIPGFNSPHLRVAGGLFVVLVLVQTLGLMGVRCDVFTAVSMGVAAIVPAYLMTVVFSQFGSFPGYINIVLAAPLVFFQVVLLALAMVIAPAETDWILQGQRPDVNVVLLSAGLFALVGIAKEIVQLPRALAEKASGAVPFDAWNFEALQRWATEGQTSGQQNWNMKLWSSGQCRRLKQAIDCPQNSPRRQALLWRASQLFTASGFLIFMSCAMGGFALIVQSVVPQQSTNYLFPKAALGQIAMFSMVVPFMIFGMQRPFLTRHLLMTIGRREWVRLIFSETARNFLPAVVFAVIGLIVCHFWAPTGFWPTWHLAILGAALLMLIFAAQLILVTFPAWVQFVAGGGTLAVLLPVGVYFSVLASFQAGEQISGVLSWPATWWSLTLFLDIVAIRFAYHRWMNWELDKIG